VGQVDKSEWRSRIIRFPIRQVDKFDGGGRSRIDRISLICPRPSLHPQKGRPGLSSMGGVKLVLPPSIRTASVLRVVGTVGRPLSYETLCTSHRQAVERRGERQTNTCESLSNEKATRAKHPRHWQAVWNTVI
jgi:hypothetical protein